MLLGRWYPAVQKKLGAELGAGMHKVKPRIRLANHKDALRFLKLEAMCFGMKENPGMTYF